MDTGNFFGSGSDSTHVRPNRDPTRFAKIALNLTRDPTRPDPLMDPIRVHDKPLRRSVTYKHELRKQITATQSSTVLVL